MRLRLLVKGGLQIGDQAHIDPPGGMIGRAEHCALYLRDDTVSRSHVELLFQQDTWWACQRSTRSPTLVDGVAVSTGLVGLKGTGVLQLGAVAIEYVQESSAEAQAPPEAPRTMINVRRQLSNIQHAVLPQLTPIRPEQNPPEAPPTLVLFRKPPALPPSLPALPPPSHDAPPTLVVRAAVGGSPPSHDAPPTLIVRAAVSGPPPLKSPPMDPSLAERLSQLEGERQEVGRERDRLSADCLRVSQENASLRDAQIALQRQVETLQLQAARAAESGSVSATNSSLAEQARQLLAPFADSIEQALEALKNGDALRARELLREASFNLGDLRDLLQPA